MLSFSSQVEMVQLNDAHLSFSDELSKVKIQAVPIDDDSES